MDHINAPYLASGLEHYPSRRTAVSMVRLSADERELLESAVSLLPGRTVAGFMREVGVVAAQWIVDQGDQVSGDFVI
jgi:hypothetical protein